MKSRRRAISFATGLALLVLVTACGDDPVEVDPDAPTINLLTPDGGNAYDPGGTLNITWTAASDGMIAGVDLSYTADNVTETVIATGETGTSFSWILPMGPLYGAKVKAVVKDDIGQTGQDESAAIFAVVQASARGYVTSSTCEDCHQTYYDQVFASSHPYKISKVVGDVAPTYPFSSVPSPPVGYDWSEITYVIGGYGWKARFMDKDGYILTTGFNGVPDAQYNIPRADLGLGSGWTTYHSTDTAPKPYDCGTCHTTGWQTFADNGGVNQDGLIGISGTWEEPGVGCEQCHEPGVDHVVSQLAADITVDKTADQCGTCHTRDAAKRVLTSGGYVRHHEQHDELLAGGPGMSALDCNDCHEPHIGTRYGHAAAGGIRAAASCESCHTGQTNSHVVDVDCETCHLPRATKSARAVNTFVGDVRTHMFQIKAAAVGKDDPTEGMWVVDTDGKEIARGFVTLDMVCYQCHDDPISKEGGGLSEQTLAELSVRATGIHN